MKKVFDIKWKERVKTCLRDTRALLAMEGLSTGFVEQLARGLNDVHQATGIVFRDLLLKRMQSTASWTDL